MPFRVLTVMIRMLALGLLAGCGARQQADPIEMKPVTLPGGQVIRAEVMIRLNDMRRGMMFRGQLATDRGLLFVHTRAGQHSYWMHNVRVPLDIIWLDKDRRIVEISPHTPACLETDPVKCPTYGGKAVSQFTLELAAGQAEHCALAIGQQLTF